MNFSTLFRTKEKLSLDKNTLTIDCIDLKKKITSKSKALLVVHPWGYPCNMDEIYKIVKDNNNKVISNSSQVDVDDIVDVQFSSSKLKTKVLDKENIDV